MIKYYKDGHFRDSYLPDIEDYESKQAEKFYNLKQPLQENRFSMLADLFTLQMEVLDIGCATAGFLNILKGHVKKVRGIELYKPHVEFAKNNLDLNVELKDIDEIKDERFDTICMFHVLEHIPEPISFIKKTYEMLNDGGMLILEVPNINDPLISVFDVAPYKNFYFMKPHLFYYGEASIEYLLNKIGFGSMEFRSFQHYGLMNHFCWSLTGETCTATKTGGGTMDFPGKYMDSPNIGLVIEFFEQMNEKYKEMVKKIGKTDTLLVIARKEK
ncbi:MAG: class I SAM-dependent methyltransferase [Pseudomonadota bacterium]